MGSIHEKKIEVENLVTLRHELEIVPVCELV